MYEGIHKIIAPEPIAHPIVAYIVLAIAMVLEGSALRTALKKKPRRLSRRVKIGGSFAPH